MQDQRVVISVDGGRTRIRHAKTGKRRYNSHRHGYKGEWIEPKLLTIYVVNPLGKRVNTAEIPVTNDGTYGKLQPFLELLEMHLVRLGINLASQVVLIADGAEWISETYPSTTATSGLSALFNTWVTRLLSRYRTFTYFCRGSFYPTKRTTGLV